MYIYIDECLLALLFSNPSTMHRFDSSTKFDQSTTKIDVRRGNIDRKLQRTGRCFLTLERYSSIIDKSIRYVPVSFHQHIKAENECQTYKNDQNEEMHKKRPKWSSKTCRTRCSHCDVSECRNISLWAPKHISLDNQTDNSHNETITYCQSWSYSPVIISLVGVGCSTSSVVTPGSGGLFLTTIKYDERLGLAVGSD